MNKKYLPVLIAFVFLSNNSALSQILKFDPVTDDLLQNPPVEEWLSWRGTPRSWGYSALDQINTENVNQLQLVWSWAIDEAI